MKITNVRVSNLELAGKNRLFDLKTISGMRRERYVQHVSSTSPGLEQVMHVETDEGIEGVCTDTPGTHGPMTKETLEQLRHLVVGEDPLYREGLYQKLHTGTRWIYEPPGWFGTFDNCLWDIVGKAAGLPLYAIFGRVRTHSPVYQNIGGQTKEEAADDARRSVADGFPAVKDHFYHPPAENIQWFEAVRDAVGPDVDVMHDAVGIYTLPQAIEVGRALERLDYRWFEEPLPERVHVNMKALCDALDIAILAPEMMMDDVDLSAQWLISGATDLIRANARHGTTAVLKLAHLAELYGTTVELNGTGGLFGLVHAHLICSIGNTSYYEYFDGSHEKSGREIGMTNPLEPVDGHISPPDGPGWGAEWDVEYLKKMTVSEL